MKKIVFTVFMILLAALPVRGQSWSFFGYGDEEREYRDDMRDYEMYGYDFDYADLYDDSYEPEYDYSYDPGDIDASGGYEQEDSYGSPAGGSASSRFVSPPADGVKFRPGDDIGLFIDPAAFEDKLGQLLGYENISITEKYSGDGFFTIVLSNNISVGGAYNEYGKIHTFVIESNDTKDDSVKALWDTIMDVLLLSGLYNTYEEFLQYMEAFPEKANPLETENFYLWGYYEEMYDEYVSALTPPHDRDLPPRPGCDPNYVGTCVPDSRIMLHCSDIGTKNFFVTGTDIHQFDPDGNGICCEPVPDITFLN